MKIKNIVQKVKTPNVFVNQINFSSSCRRTHRKIKREKKMRKFSCKTILDQVGIIEEIIIFKLFSIKYFNVKLNLRFTRKIHCKLQNTLVMKNWAAFIYLLIYFYFFLRKIKKKRHEQDKYKHILIRLFVKIIIKKKT